MENQVITRTNPASSWPVLPDFLMTVVEGFGPPTTWPNITREHLPALTTAIRHLEPVPVRSSPELLERLGRILAGVFSSQKIYNTPVDRDAMAARKRLFVEILGDYPIDAIDRAFIAYCADRDDIPAPANIKKLVESDLKLMKVRLMISRMKKMKKMAENQ